MALAITETQPFWEEDMQVLETYHAELIARDPSIDYTVYA
jgi:hypothetical protein